MSSPNSHQITKRCTKCRLLQALSCFYKKREGTLQSWCKDCQYALNQKNRFANNYGITVEEFLALIAKQGGLCAICGEVPVLRNGARQGLFVDHNHITGQVRELLCQSCNTMLGAASDDPRVLTAGAAYLEKFS